MSHLSDKHLLELTYDREVYDNYMYPLRGIFIRACRTRSKCFIHMGLLPLKHLGFIISACADSAHDIW